jgi:radical SAM superfamily enzyme YgiQ (UPF0313 family)
MKVALIDPPHQAFMGYRRFYFPLGIVSVGTALARNGHEVRIFDEEHLPEGCCLSNAAASNEFHRYYDGVTNAEHPIWKALHDKLLAFLPDIVGITVLSCKVDSALAIARMVRTILPHARVMLGGDHVLACARELILHDCVDAVVLGEGEETACELVAAWQHNRSLRGIAGLATREAGKPVVNPRRPLIGNLDSIPTPDRSLLNHVESYTPTDLGLMMTSRGCSQRCTFCGIGASFGREVRYRSIQACLREISETHDKYGTQYFSFRDGTFTADRARTEVFCRALISDQPNVKWECLTRADCLDGPLLDLMLKANCLQLRIGIESGSPRILRHIQKDTTIEEYVRAADLLNSRGMYWSAYVMLGLPEETVEDIQMTMDLLVQLQPSFVTMSRFVPLPGTISYKSILKAGRQVKWLYQNNMCLEDSYCNNVPVSELQSIIKAAFTFAEEYNAQHTSSSAYDHRISYSGVDASGGKREPNRLTGFTRTSCFGAPS